MQNSNKVTGMIAGAGAAMVALTTLALMLFLRINIISSMTAFWQMWALALTSAAATILVMGILQSRLVELYGQIADSETLALKDARNDALTGLGNRKLLVEQIRNEMTVSIDKSKVVLLLIDLNGFKRINDAIGHHSGDELLKCVARRLTEKLPGAVIARLGGDEFAIIHHIRDETFIPALCNCITEIISAPYCISNTDVSVGASIGALTFCLGSTPSELMRRADIAMYLSKSSGVDYVIFDRFMLKDVERRKNLQENLREELVRGKGLGAEIQPIVDRAGSVIAFEALLRWVDKEYGPISATEAISVAQDGGLTEAISLAMARYCCRVAKAFPGKMVSMNLSSSELLRKHFCRTLVSLVRGEGVDPNRIRLEMNDTILTEGGYHVEVALRALKLAGFRLAVDNFGKGPSSLRCLQKYQISEVKFDRALVEEAKQSQNISVLRASIQLAKALNLEVTCTGISVSDDQAIALQAGADALQGYHYSVPLPLEEHLRLREISCIKVA